MKNKQEIKVFDCIKCRSSVKINNKLYCRTKLKDMNILSDYALVNKVNDCIWYKEKKWKIS